MVDHTAMELSEDDITVLDLELDKILLATDGSKHSIKATKTAIGLAKLVEAKVHAVFVDTGADEAQLPEENLTEQVELGVHPNQAGITVAKKFGEKNGVQVETEVLTGGVTKQIIKYAQENDMDLIVMGESGRTGLARITLGSVAEGVIKSSEIPVWVDR
ncbi:universal stress protein [Fuchsiella alkaliacetigena]|uniref:universal stress protein n=1 Tax=Fuchsiella alkaliacetigena TaxID=957042 RepID=UPI00200A56C4|nr:universal stress protein [Fuchsiella alkaliacetigena]MCK8825563.1 universal stress protein [Fuchsiella alkaliacetigena]